MAAPNTVPRKSRRVPDDPEDFRLTLGNDLVRQPAVNILKQPEFIKGLDTLAERIDLMTELLQTQAGRSPDLERAWQRCTALGQDLMRWKRGVQNQPLAGAGLCPARRGGGGAHLPRAGPD